MELTPYRNGYTLIELSVVVALIGILMGTALSVGNISVEKSNIVTTDTSLDTIEKAIQLFYNQNKRVPCPASPTQAPNTANFGVEDNCSNATPALGGIVELNDGTPDEQWVGTLPVRSLGLPDSAMVDRWNSRLVYGVQKNFADSSKTFTGEVANSLATMIKIRDKGGNTINPNAVAADLQNPVVYVLLSLGKDKMGAYNKAGTLPVSCAATNTQRDVQNCDFTIPATKNSIFVDTDIADSTTTAEYFYDRMRWKTKVNFGIVPQPSPSVIVDSLFVAWNVTCLLTSDSKIKCSGDNANKHLGNGSVGDTTSFTEEANHFSDWIRVKGDWYGGCGIRSNQSAYCWGGNSDGQLGNGTYSGDVDTPVLVTGGYSWKDIEPNETHTCGITTAGKMYCWGKNDVGQAGNATTGGSFNIPTPVLGTGGIAAYTDWAQLSVGDATVCGIRSNKQAYCWGDNSLGQIGDGTAINRNTPTPISGGTSDWMQVRTDGSTGACGVRTSGRAYCWGDNGYGQLGKGSAGNSLVPVEVAGGYTDWTSIVQGYNIACGLRGTGIAYCWGSDQFGSLGLATSPTVDQFSPQLVSGGITDWKFIAPDQRNHSCAIRSNGNLYCWGINDNGQFGNGSTSNSIVGPTLIPAVTAKTN